MSTEFKIRCSAIGTIMGQKGLGKTGETYLKQWYKETLYSRTKEFSSKYTDKGLTMEDNALDYTAKMLGLGMLVKNEKHYGDSDIIGTPDIVLPEMILDVKCSWDCFTFPLFESELTNTDYYWQMQGYMALTGAKQAKVCYCLMDTPEHIIDKEATSKCWELNGNGEYDPDIYEAVKAKHIYSHLPDALRFKAFTIERNDTDIEAIRKRVAECRIYLETIKIKENK